MTRKQKTYKELETENTRGKKRYLERMIENEEAEKSIEDYLNHPRQGNPEQEEINEDRTANRPFS